MQLFTEEDVRRLLPMSDAIDSLRSAFQEFADGKAQNQVRRRLHLESGATLHSLAGSCGGYFGTKIYSTHPKHGAHFTFLLYDASTGRPLAQFEANYLGQIRTGAASGLAASVMTSEDDELSIAVIGSGFQAASQVDAVAAVRRIRELRLWSRDAAKRQAFADDLRTRHQFPIQAASTAEEAAANADVVITATYAKDPVIARSALPDDALVIAVGSNNPSRRELDSATVTEALVVVDDLDAARTEAGDLLLAFAPNNWDRVLELKNLVARKAKAGREDRLRVFKSVGLGLEDVAVAARVYEQATLASGSADRNPATR